MSDFHELRVRDIRRETEDTVSIAFDVPDELKETYNFKPGQYLTLETAIDGENVRRSYSLCTAPVENDLRVAVKKVPGGKFSTYANEVLKEGDSMKVMKPEGRFTTPIDANNKKHYVMFAAGSGITPIMSLVKTILKEQPQSEVTLFYGNRTQSSIIFRDQLEDIKNSYVDRFTVYHILSKENLGIDLYAGRIDKEKCEIFNDKVWKFSFGDEFFLCGPFEMITSVSAYLQELGIDKHNIHFELFTPPDKQKAAQTDQPGVKEELPSGLSHITITVDGDEYTFELDKDGDSILDAAMNTGADVPFSCKGGVCCTCKAHVEKGEVKMEVNYALEEDEVQNGYVLTCQSHPISDEVVLNFDV